MKPDATRMNLGAINILKGLAYSQLQLQDMRTNLLQSSQIHDLQIFQQIDRKRTDRVTPQQLINFLGVHRIATNQRECQYLIWLTGSNQPHLTHAQFVEYLTNSSGQHMAHMQSSGVGSRLMPTDALLKSSSERQIAKLFEKEIEYYRAIEQLREEFVKNYGFSFKDVISHIDRQHKGNITIESMVNFVHQHQIDFSREEFEAICRKVRARDQMSLSYKEAMRAFAPFEPLHFPTYRKQGNLQKAMDHITQQVKLLDIDTYSPFGESDAPKTRTGFQKVLEQFRNPATQGTHLTSNYFYDKNYYNQLRQYKTTFFDPNKDVKKKIQNQMVGPQYHDHFFADYYLHLEERNKTEHYYNKFGKRYAFENTINRTTNSNS